MPPTDLLPETRHRDRHTLWLTFVSLFLVGLTSWAGEQPKPKKYSSGVVIRFTGDITPMLEQYLYRKLDVARKSGADLVIVEIDSPGGLVDSSLAIAERLRDLNWAHTVAYIPREALSGAAIAALGCDEIVMHPRASLGDAGPIFLDENFLFRHAPEKFRSNLAQKVRDLADAKDRPPALAEAMVDMDLVVFRVKDEQTGEEAFMSDEEIESDNNPDRWKKINPVLESREDHFLQVSGQRAVELRLAEATASNRSAMLHRYNLPEDPLVLEPSGVDTAVYILNLPIVTGLLFVVGLVALYIEFMAPGISVGGLTAGLCFALFFWSRFLGGTAGWLEVVLFLAGLVFIAVELFVIPGFGVAGLSGILLIIVSLLMASQHHFLPKSGQDFSTLITSLGVIVASFVVVVAAAFAMSRYFGTIPILSRFALAPPEPSAAADDHQAGEERLEVGQIGLTDSPLRPAGVVRFGERYVDVLTEGGFIEKGQEVKVVKISGNHVVVRQA
jgi:membrane-bound serine protease (ClpP class)